MCFATGVDARGSQQEEGHELARSRERCQRDHRVGGCGALIVETNAKGDVASESNGSLIENVSRTRCTMLPPLEDCGVVAAKGARAATAKQLWLQGRSGVKAEVKWQFPKMFSARGKNLILTLMIVG